MLLLVRTSPVVEGVLYKTAPWEDIIMQRVVVDMGRSNLPPTQHLLNTKMEPTRCCNSNTCFSTLPCYS